MSNVSAGEVREYEGADPNPGQPSWKITANAAESKSCCERHPKRDVRAFTHHKSQYFFKKKIIY